MTSLLFTVTQPAQPPSVDMAALHEFPFFILVTSALVLDSFLQNASFTPPLSSNSFTVSQQLLLILQASLSHTHIPLGLSKIAYFSLKSFLVCYINTLIYSLFLLFYTNPLTNPLLSLYSLACLSLTFIGTYLCSIFLSVTGREEKDGGMEER